MRYVDLGDADTAARWGYPGAWGGATMVDAPDVSGDYHHHWGWHQGVRRPNLSAWFMWNLLGDSAVGCAGVLTPTATPGP